MKDDFQLKEINTKGRVTFQNEGNEHNVHNESKLFETTELDGNFVFASFPEPNKGATAVSVEIWPLRGFFTVSLILADLHPDKILPFCWCQECQICIKNLGPK